MIEFIGTVFVPRFHEKHILKFCSYYIFLLDGNNYKYHVDKYVRRTFINYSKSILNHILKLLLLLSCDVYH